MSLETLQGRLNCRGLTMEDIHIIREDSRVFILDRSHGTFLYQQGLANLRQIAVDVAFTLEYYYKHRNWINKHLQEHNQSEKFQYLNSIAWKFTINVSSTDDKDAGLAKTANAAQVVDVSKNEATGGEEGSFSRLTEKVAELESKSSTYISVQNILMRSKYIVAVIELPAVSSALVDWNISYSVDNTRELEH